MIGSLVTMGCSDSTPPSNAVLFSSVDATYTKQVIDLFEGNETFVVDVVSDTEATKSTGLVNRLVAERDRPVADVFWSGDPVRAAFLLSEGIAEPAEISDVGNASRVRLIMVNTRLSSDKQIWPKSVLDLAKPEFAPYSCLANPQFGTTSMHAALLFEHLGEEDARAFFAEFTANGGRMLASNGEVKRRVGNGEFRFGLTDSDDISVALSDEKPVDFIVPDQNDGAMGAVFIPTVALQIKGAPNSENAARLIEFLQSSETEKIMAESVAAHLPHDPSVEVPAVFRNVDWKSVKRAEVDYIRVAQRLEQLHQEFFPEWVSEQSD